VKILAFCERVDAEGGTETYLRALLPALAARGHGVHVLARSASRPDAYGVPIEVVEWSDEHDPPSAGAAEAVARIASALAPDVAVVHNVLDAGVLAAVRRSVPRVVYHQHDNRPFCPNGDRVYPRGGGICSVAMGAAGCGWHALVNGCAYGPRLRTLELVRIREAVARAVASSDASIAFSQYVAALAGHNGIPSQKTQVVSPPLEDAAFAAYPVPRPGTDSVLFAGRIVPSKGGRSLVRALSEIPSPVRPRLRVAGDGPDLTATLAEARARNVAIDVLGRLDAPAMRAAYDGASLVAVPSLWGEPFGLVGIEAFARGRPVVAYDAGAISEWMSASHGGGRIVPLGNERALAEGVTALLSPDGWTEASNRAFSAARAYRLGPHLDRIEAIYSGERVA
jgi:glycosyltransferase involved in cell wall biosynthesis